MDKKIAPVYYKAPWGFSDIHYYKNYPYHFSFYDLDFYNESTGYATFYYRLDGIDVTSLKVDIPIIWEKEWYPDTNRVAVTPFISDLKGNKIRNYATAEEKTYVSEGQYNYVTMSFSFIGNGQFSNSLLGVELAFTPEVSSSHFGDYVTLIGPINIEVNGSYTISGDSSIQTYLPSQMSGALQGIGKTILEKINDGIIAFSEKIQHINQTGVTFYDHDGSVVYEFSVATFSKLSSMPQNPKHIGLKAQGWNWSLEAAQDYVSKYGRLIIGQNYITSDETTRLYIYLTNDCLDFELEFDVIDKVGVDWGDTASQEDFKSITYEVASSVDIYGARIRISHTYTEPGEYIISITPIGGIVHFSSFDHSPNPQIGATSLFGDKIERVLSLTKIEFGSNVTVGDYAFYNCENLKCIVIPNELTHIGRGAFENCPINAIILPRNSHIEPAAFEKVNGDVIALPDLIDIIEDGGIDSFHTTTLTIPQGIEILNFGSRNLLKLVLPDSIKELGNHSVIEAAFTNVFLPNSIERIGEYTFSGCLNLREIVIPEKVHIINKYTFYNCMCLLRIIFLGSILRIKAHAFENCFRLSDFFLPNELEIIEESAFENCKSLKMIRIPASVTAIDDMAFYGCSSLQKIFFEGAVPPILTGTPFYELPTTCPIYVPKGSLEAYTNMANYPSSSAYIYIELDSDFQDNSLYATIDNTSLEITGTGAQTTLDKLSLDSSDAYIKSGIISSDGDALIFLKSEDN